jgi:hypothetical protein
MKKALMACLSVLFMIGFARAGFAVQGPLTLDSVINSSGDYQDGINLSFETGTYEFSVVSGAWNAWSNVSGCNNSGADCTSGWMWSMDIFQPSTSTYFRLGSKIDRYDSPDKALSAHAGDYLILNQPADGDLWFFIKDGNPGDGKTLVGDNSGTVTFAISSVPPPSSAPLAPEPVSSILFVIGGATFGFRRFWNKRSV